VIVRTFDGLKALTTPEPNWFRGSAGSLTLYNHRQAYAEIYRTQPNVRICVDFLSRNIAELAPQAFRRISDTDRERLADHELTTWLAHPNPATTRYRLQEALMGDLGIYFNAYWLKVRYKNDDGRKAIGLVRLPPEEMTVKGGLLPTEFCWTSDGKEQDFPLSEIVYFNGYNPCTPLMGLSPLETLRRILAEEAAANDHREAYWRNAGRQESVIEVSKDGPNYTGSQLQDFRKQLQEFSGSGAKVGQTMVLPKGMTHKSASFSAKDSEFIQGGKLRREVCAAAYMIPLPLVGILEHATFSNIKEQHKHLYQDCLGPWLEMIVQETERQLLVEADDQQNVYLEYNIAAKLAGTPDERAVSIQLSTGRPWRTVNEARALENLPRIDDPELDEVAPQQGGPAATGDPTRPDPDADVAGDTETDDAEAIIQKTRLRQLARVNKHPAEERHAAFFADADRWNRELTEDLTPLVGAGEAARLAVEANAATFLEIA
jgi:HK97 family phage portal protein